MAKPSIDNSALSLFDSPVLGSSFPVPPEVFAFVEAVVFLELEPPLFEEVFVPATEDFFPVVVLLAVVFLLKTVLPLVELEVLKLSEAEVDVLSLQYSLRISELRVLELSLFTAEFFSDELSLNDVELLSEELSLQ